MGMCRIAKSMLLCFIILFFSFYINLNFAHKSISIVTDDIKKKDSNNKSLIRMIAQQDKIDINKKKIEILNERLNELDKKQRESILTHIGYVYVYGAHHKNNYDFFLPYFDVAYRDHLSGDLFYELNLAYISFERNYYAYSDPNVIPSEIIFVRSKIHEFPLTVNFIYDINIATFININPMLGSGLMLSYVYSDYDDGGVAIALVFKPGIEIAYNVFEDFKLIFNTSVLIKQNIVIGLKSVDYYLIPNLGVQYLF